MSVALGFADFSGLNFEREFVTKAEANELPNCGRETQPTFFCHACDVYLADPAVGERAGVARRLAAQFKTEMSA